MSRKLFISVLGTGFYNKCQYVDSASGFCSTPTRYVQQATLELLENKQVWTEEDKVVILLTQEARRQNWDKTIAVRNNKNTGQEEQYIRLEQVLENMLLDVEIEGVNVPEGKNEDEMWQIFTTVFEQIEQGDELYFDLTHGFRYLPMLVLVLSNYTKFLKGTKTVHVSYGNFEARTGDGAPIVDLLPLISLQNWTMASANFLENGRVDQLEELTQNFIRPILRETQGKHQGAKQLCLFIRHLAKQVDNMVFCRGLALMDGKQGKAVKQAIDNLEDCIIPPLMPVINRIREVFGRFASDDSIANGLNAAQWCYDKHLYQQAVTILHECLNSMVCLQAGIDVAIPDERDLVNSAFCILNNQMPEAQWRLPGKAIDGQEQERKREQIRQLLRMPLLQALAPIFTATTELRNDYNHCGFRPQPLCVDKMRTNMKARLDQVAELCAQFSAKEPTDD